MPERLTRADHYPLIAASALTIPFLAALFFHDYVPGWDESFQLSAAGRLAEGLGLSIYQTGLVLHENDFRFLAEWAPGYSMMIALLLKAGLSLDIASKAFKTAAILTALYTWFRLAHRYTGSRMITFLFLAFLTGLMALNHGNVTDIMIIMLFPVLTLLVTGEHRPCNFLWISLVLALMVLFKYSMTFLLAGVAFWILWEFRNRLSQAIGYLFISLMLPLLLWLTLIIVSKNLWGRFTFFDKNPFPDNFSDAIGFVPGILTEWIAGLTIKPFFGVVNNFSIINHPWFIPMLVVMILLLPPVILILIRVYHRGEADRRMIIWIITTALASLLMLGGMTFKYPRDLYYPAREVRYFIFLTLLIYVVILSWPKWVGLVKKNKLIRSGIFTGGVFLVFLMAMTLFSMRFGQLWAEYSSEKQFVTEVVNEVEHENPSGTSVVISYTRFRITQWENLVPRTVLVQPNIDYFPKEIAFENTPLVFFIFDSLEVLQIPGLKDILKDTSLQYKKKESLLIAWRPYINGERFKK